MSLSCGKGIRSWIVLRSDNTAAKYLTKAWLVGDGKRQPRVNCGLCFSLPDSADLL